MFLLYRGHDPEHAHIYYRSIDEQFSQTINVIATSRGNLAV